MKNTRVGFTVIEMMIVIVIIAILSGFVFRMMTLAGQKNSSAETKALLEKIANAIEAYRGEYGSYPPVAVYKCNDGSLIQPTFYEYTYGSGLEALPSQLAAQLMNESRKKNLWDEYPVFTFGLASYLYPRYWGTGSNAPQEFFDEINYKKVIDGEMPEKENILNQWGSHNDKRAVGKRVKLQDMDKDMNAIRRILPLLETYVDSKITKKGQKEWSLKKNEKGEPDCGIGIWFQYSSDIVKWRDKSGKEIITGKNFAKSPYDNYREYKGYYYANYAIGFQDSWGQMVHYQSNPPYDSFRIWSAGMDRKTCDPVCDDPKTCSACRDDIIIGLE